LVGEGFALPKVFVKIQREPEGLPYQTSVPSMMDIMFGDV
jgi:hypothetical protein